MFRSSARPSAEATLSAIEQLCGWAQRARAVTLLVCLAAGIAGGLLALERLQIWAHVFVLAYGSVGLATGFLVYGLIARPLLNHALRRRVRRVVAARGLQATEEIEAVARAFLV